MCTFTFEHTVELQSGKDIKEKGYQHNVYIKYIDAVIVYFIHIYMQTKWRSRVMQRSSHSRVDVFGIH